MGIPPNLEILLSAENDDNSLYAPLHPFKEVYVLMHFKLCLLDARAPLTVT